MANLFYLPQFKTTTLNVGGGIDSSQTTGIILQSVTGIDITKPGIICISWADPLDTGTAEWISYTSIDGSNELQGVTRDAEGTGAHTHSNGAVIAYPVSKAHINNINDKLTGVDTTVLTDTAGTTLLKTGTGLLQKPSSLIIPVAVTTTSLTVGDGKYCLTIPEELDGMNLVGVHARVITAGTTGTTDIQIANVTDGVDMLSTKLTIDSGETGSDTAATAAVIDTSKDDVATNDLLRIDIDAVSTTAPKGLIIRLRFALP